jgi:4-hydroxy-2-oxoheptanedioate aldolase
LSRDDAVLRGVMCVIPSAVAAQAIAAAGADLIVIDREHRPTGRETMHAMIAATAGTACSALVGRAGHRRSRGESGLGRRG